MQQKTETISQKLIDRAAARREDAVSALFEKTYNEVYCSIKAMVLDENVTRDLVRDTYVTGMQGLRMLPAPEQFPEWIRMVAHSETIAWLCRRTPSLFSRMLIDHTETQEFDDEYPERLSEIEMEERVATALLTDLMRTLPEDQRVCVVLYYYERRAVPEIAHELGITQDTVRSRLNYSKWKIKARVRELERNDVNLYGFKTRHAIAFLVFLFRKHEALLAEQDVPEGMLQGIMNDLQQAGYAEAEETADEEAAAKKEREAERAKKRRAARQRKRRIGVTLALIVVALLAVAVVMLSVRAHRRNRTDGGTASGTTQSARTGDKGDASTGTDTGAGTPDDAAGADDGAASGTSAADASSAGTYTLPAENLIAGVYSEKDHGNWMEITAKDGGTYDVTFHGTDRKGGDFSRTCAAKAEDGQLLAALDDAGSTGVLRWANEYTVSVNDGSYFEDQEGVTISGLYMNAATPLRGGSGIDAYLGGWVSRSADKPVSLTLQMSAGALRAVLSENGETKADHTYPGFEVQTGVNGLPSKLRAHLSESEDETFWLFPDGTITFHSSGSEYDGINFQQD